MEALKLNGYSLTLEDITEVARGFREVELAPEAVEKVNKSRNIVETKAMGEKLIYSINTGFGDLCNVKISKKDLKKLQVNLIRSHAVGVGDELSQEQVRATMLIRVNTLLQGNSGIRLEVIELLISFLNYRIHPCIPSQGSVGSSGDLAPLAHMSLPLIGEGEVMYEDKKVETADVLRRTGLTPVELQCKEGLALINGTAVMSGIGALALVEAEELAKMADISGTMSLEALKGVDNFARAEIHQMRPHKGQIEAAENMRNLIKGSGIIDKFRDSGKVQDAYSLRCMPQVHGASRDSLRHVRSVLEVEVNSVTDNPLVVLETEEIISGGNFHGQPVALVMDFLAIATSEIANIAESRVSRLINSRYSDLPAFLVEDSGLNSGFMVAQYTVAALVSENKVLCHPASVDSIPTCAGQEDHVSMGTIAARKAAKVVRNVSNVIAIEFLAAAQALEFLAPLESSPSIEAVHKLIRRDVPKFIEDRRIDVDIAKVRDLMSGGKIIYAVENVIGKLN
jgi:histidine ammonia-lyase